MHLPTYFALHFISMLAAVLPPWTNEKVAAEHVKKSEKPCQVLKKK